MIYYICDLHLFHKNVTDEGTNFDNRPFKTLDDMHGIIKKNWNGRITGADHIYLVGDACWKHNEDSIALMSQLKGNKHLIAGNHDYIDDQRYRQLFVEICDYKEIKDTIDGKQYGVVLSHFPIAFWNHQHKYTRDCKEHKNWSIQLYGHVHDSIEEKIFQNFIRELNDKYNIACEAYNIGCMMEYMNFMPRTLKEIREGASNIKN